MGKVTKCFNHRWKITTNTAAGMLLFPVHKALNFLSCVVFSRTGSGCEVRLWALSQQKAKVLGTDCSSRVRSSFLLSAVWCQGPTLGWKSNAVYIPIDVFFASSPIFVLSSFNCRRCLVFVCIRDLGAGSPSEPCWSLEVCRRVRRWCSLFLRIACPPERDGYSCWRLLTFTGRYLALFTQGRITGTHKNTDFQEKSWIIWRT